MTAPIGRKEVLEGERVELEGLTRGCLCLSRRAKTDSACRPRFAVPAARTVSRWAVRAGPHYRRKEMSRADMEGTSARQRPFGRSQGAVRFRCRTPHGRTSFRCPKRGREGEMRRGHFSSPEPSREIDVPGCTPYLQTAGRGRTCAVCVSCRDQDHTCRASQARPGEVPFNVSRNASRDGSDTDQISFAVNSDQATVSLARRWQHNRMITASTISYPFVEAKLTPIHRRQGR